LRAPSELALHLAGIDGIAKVVPGPVLHELDERLMSRDAVVERQLVEQGADRADHVDVFPLAPAADEVRLAGYTTLENMHERGGVIVHKKPIAYVLAPPIDRQTAPGECTHD